MYERTLTPRDHNPAARCCVCGSPDIAAVCHHCGRGMCKEHETGETPAARGVGAAFKEALKRWNRQNRVFLKTFRSAPPEPPPPPPAPPPSVTVMPGRQDGGWIAVEQPREPGDGWVSGDGDGGAGGWVSSEGAEASPEASPEAGASAEAAAHPAQAAGAQASPYPAVKVSPGGKTRRLPGPERPPVPRETLGERLRRSLREARKPEPGPPVARLSLLDEILLALRLARPYNPEFEYLLPPLRRTSGLPAQVDSLRLRLTMATRLEAVLKPKNKYLTGQRHCPQCSHFATRPTGLVWLSWLLLALGLVAMALGTLWILNVWFLYGYFEALFALDRIGFFLFSLFWVALATLAVYFTNSAHDFLFRRELARTPQMIPFLGNLQKMTAEEVRTGSIRLDGAGRYTFDPGEVHGKVTVPVQVSSQGREIYQGYRKRADLLGLRRSDQPRFTAGFVQFGPAAWDPDDMALLALDPIHIADLNLNPLDREFRSFLRQSDVTHLKRTFEFEYRVPHPQPLAQKYGGLPFQVIVSFKPSAEPVGLRRTLRLEIEFDPALLEHNPAVVEQLRLYIPAALGRVTALEPEGRLETSPQPGQSGPAPSTATWRNLVFNHAGRFRREVALQFEEPVDPGEVLHGDLHVALPAAVYSGLDEIKFFDQLGKPLDRFKPAPFEKKTRLQVSLELDLSGLTQRSDETFERALFGDGVVPASRLITRLAAALSARGYYLKRITESPVRTSKESAHKLNRYWDLVGRGYEGVYPFHFHLVISGAEETEVQDDGSVVLVEGSTHVFVSVKAAVTDQMMAARVREVGRDLSELIQNELY